MKTLLCFSVHDKSLEDRMESFFLSETSKYLYLLFDKDHVINKKQQEFLFSTEGHLFRLTALMRNNPSLHSGSKSLSPDQDCHPTVTHLFANSTAESCSSIDEERKYAFPMKLGYYKQLQAFVGIE